METQLPPDFSEFLSLLNARDVEYLLVGGYAVGFHGYIRVTGDIDIWVRQSPENAARVVEAIREFGFGSAGPEEDRFIGDGKITRMGVPPHRIEVMTSISGVTFDECWPHRVQSDWDGVQVPIIDLSRLRLNKQASGRLKDLADLDALPEAPGGDTEAGGPA